MSNVVVVYHSGYGHTRVMAQAVAQGVERHLGSTCQLIPVEEVEDHCKPSQGMIDWFWVQGMAAGHKNAYDCIKAFSETDFTEDLKKFDIPTLVVHGDADQVVPIEAAGIASAALIKGSTLKIYPGAPHGLTDTHKDQLNADLLAFLKG
jgi:pimeloyl-ACP methyl ester carboxylesterase